MALLLVLIVSSFVSPRFLSLPNLLNVLRQVAIVGILAIGQTFVILTAGIDLSVGAIIGLCVVLFADILQTQSLAIAIPCELLCGGVIGMCSEPAHSAVWHPLFIIPCWVC